MIFLRSVNSYYSVSDMQCYFSDSVNSISPNLAFRTVFHIG